VRTDATLTIRNGRLHEAVRLDSNGIPTGPAACRSGPTSLTLNLPHDALYTILR
jgi:hypothetical protein